MCFVQTWLEMYILCSTVELKELALDRSVTLFANAYCLACLVAFILFELVKIFQFIVLWSPYLVLFSAVKAGGRYLHSKGAFLLQQHATSSCFPQSMLCRQAVCQSKGHMEAMHMLSCSSCVCREIY